MEKEQNDIAHFLSAIWRPGDVREIRAIDDRGFITYGYFDSSELAEKAVTDLDGQNAQIYITLNPCKPELLARAKNRLKRAGKKDTSTTDRDIAELRLLLIDLDPTRPAGISSSSDELEIARTLALRIQADLGAPFITGMSGNGYHLIYRHDATTPEQLKQYLNVLQTKYGGNGVDVDVKCFNPSRITKILGTWARKGDSTEDRPHRQSRVLEVGENSVVLHIPEIEQKKTQQHPVTIPSMPFDVRSFLGEYGVIIREEKPWNDCTMLVLESCIFDPNHKGKDAAILIHPDGKITYQCFHNSCHGRTWPEAREYMAGPKPMPTCQYCGALIEWQDKKPHNPDDGTRHQCQQPQRERGGDVEIEESELEAPEVKEDSPLPLARIHPFIRAYLNSIRNTTDCPEEYIAVALLASLAAAIGNKAMLQIGHGIRPNLYCILVGESTFHRKTTALNYGLAPFVKIDFERQREYESDMAKYATALDAWDRKKDPDGEPQQPKWARLIYPSEITPEQLLVRMQDKPDALFRHSEMATLLAKMDSSYSSGFKEMMTDLYDAPKFYDRETKTKGIVRIENAAPSLCAATTWTWLQRHLSEGDLLSGFLARFCFAVRRAYPSQTIAIPSFFELPGWAEEPFRLLTQSERRWTLALSPEAREWYENWYAGHHAQAIQENKFLHGFLGRLETTVHKVAIINHCLTYCATDAPSEIGVKSYEQALAWIEYFEANIKGCFEELTGGGAIEQKLLEIIRKRGDAEGKIPRYKLIQYANMKKRDVMEYIETLESKRLLLSVTKGKYNYYQIKRDRGNR